MNNMWYYYETFLEQTQTLTVDPIRKMAKQFTILKVSARRERERGGWVDGKRERVCVFFLLNIIFIVGTSYCVVFVIK